MAPEKSQRKKCPECGVSFSKRQWFRHKQKFLDGSWKRHNANGKLIIEVEDPLQSDEDNNGDFNFLSELRDGDKTGNGNAADAVPDPEVLLVPAEKIQQRCQEGSWNSQLAVGTEFFSSGWKRTRKRKRERSNNRGNTSQPDEHQLTETVVPITTEDTSQHIDIEQVQSPAETSTSVVSSQDATEAAAALSDPSSVADNSATGNEQSTPLVIDLERLPLSNSSDVVDLTKDTGPKFIDLTADDSPIPTASYRFIDNWYRPRRFRQTRRSSARQAASSSTLSDTQNDSLEELPQVLPNFSLSASPSHQNTPSPAKRNITCPICMDDEKQIVRGHRQLMSTLCGHVFCDKCIREAVQVQHKCPTCRRKLTQRQMHPLFI